MEFLHSNYPPCIIRETRSFFEAFYDLLAKTERLDIAVGYVTSDSLAELKQIAELNKNIQKLNLTIGMHYIEHFSPRAYKAACVLNKYLLKENRGEVRLVTPFRYHGKLYSFSSMSETFACIIGSDNLNSILDTNTRTYESSVLIDDQYAAAELNSFIQCLVNKSTNNIADLEINKFNGQDNVLDGHEGAVKLELYDIAECLNARTDVSFDIPITTFEKAPKSNINAYFGKSRERNGVGLPRHWYEVELIVHKNITSHPDYPGNQANDAEFDVITAFFFFQPNASKFA